MWFRSLDQEAPLEEEMAAHSSFLAWEMLWTEEPDGPRSMGSDGQRSLASYFVSDTHAHTLCLSLCVSHCISLCLYLCLSLCLCVCVSLYLYLRLTLSLSPSVFLFRSE